MGARFHYFADLLRLAWRNVSRHRQRTIMALGAIAFGVASLILSGGFVADIYVKLAETLVHSQLGHVQIAQPGYFEANRRDPNAFLVDPGKLTPTLGAAHAQVKSAMSRLMFSGTLSNGRGEISIIGEGGEADKEAALGTFVSYTAGQALRAEDGNGIAIGVGLATALDVKVGDVVTLMVSTSDGALNTGEFQIKGIFRSFFKEYDAHAIRVNLPAAQKLIDVSGVSVMVVELKETGLTDEAMLVLRDAARQRGLEAKSWNEISDFYDKTTKLYERQFGAMRLLIALMVALAVINMVNMSIMERLAEFGTMRALGNAGRHVFWLILAESGILGVLGALAGVGLGLVAAKAISAIGIAMPPPPGSDTGYAASIQILPLQLVGAFLLGVVATAAASVFPARRASRVDICSALRQAL